MSWEHEKALVRDGGNFRWNLAIGDPVIVRNTIKDVFVLPYRDGYPTMKMEKPLEQVARNVLDITSDFLIPTVGAKQALHAALFALSQGPVKPKVALKTPYWVSYPSMANMAGLEICDTQTKSDDDINIVCVPSNPNGDVRYNHYVYPEIWDAAYASP